MAASDSTDAPDGRLAATTRTLARLADRLTRGVALLTALSGAAGVGLWGVLWWPPGAGGAYVLGAGLTLLLLLAPAAVLGLFWVGLRDLRALPSRLAEHSRRTVDETATAARRVGAADERGLGARAWRLVTQIWALRTLLQDHRALLLRYGALLRFVNPGFLLLVVAAAAGSLLLIPLSAIAGLVAVLW
jgi:hypothetical protein